METRSRKTPEEQATGAIAETSGGSKLLTVDEVELVNKSMIERDRRLRIREQQVEAAERQGGNKFDPSELMCEMVRIRQNLEENRGNNRFDPTEIVREMARMNRNLEDV
ncbi:hypothetical protein KM043_018889, partial [Ampulex compressa]